MDNKDKSIITQVAAKIAADMIPKTDDMTSNLSAFATATVDIRDILFDLIGGASAPVSDESTLRNSFPTASEVSLQVVGSQHGDLPDWLVNACRKDGISRIYDNRDGLAQNPKRPWFKAVDDKEKAYWPPRG